MGWVLVGTEWICMMDGVGEWVRVMVEGWRGPTECIEVSEQRL